MTHITICIGRFWRIYIFLQFKESVIYLSIFEIVIEFVFKERKSKLEFQITSTNSQRRMEEVSQAIWFPKTNFKPQAFCKQSSKLTLNLTRRLYVRDFYQVPKQLNRLMHVKHISFCQLNLHELLRGHRFCNTVVAQGIKFFEYYFFGINFYGSVPRKCGVQNLFLQIALYCPVFVSFLFATERRYLLQGCEKVGELSFENDKKQKFTFILRNYTLQLRDCS